MKILLSYPSELNKGEGIHYSRVLRRLGHEVLEVNSASAPGPGEPGRVVRGYVIDEELAANQKNNELSNSLIAGAPFIEEKVQEAAETSHSYVFSEGLLEVNTEKPSNLVVRESFSFAPWMESAFHASQKEVNR